MASTLRPQPDARAVSEPEAAAFGLFLRHFQPFPSPDALDPLLVHPPAFDAQQSADPPIAIAAVGRRQADDRRGQRLLIITDDGPPALRRARLADHRASPALRDINPGAHMRDAVPAAGRAQYFPSSASFRISLSSVSSDITLRSRSFSRSRSFILLAWSSFSPP